MKLCQANLSVAAQRALLTGLEAAAANGRLEAEQSVVACKDPKPLLNLIWAGSSCENGKLVAWNSDLEYTLFPEFGKAHRTWSQLRAVRQSDERPALSSGTTVLLGTVTCITLSVVGKSQRSFAPIAIKLVIPTTAAAQCPQVH